MTGVIEADIISNLNPNVLGYVQRLVNGDKTLEEINLGWHNLTYTNIILLFEALKTYSKHPNCGHCTLHPKEKHFRSGNLWRLAINDNNIGVEGMKVVASALRSMALTPFGCSLKSLDIDHNNIGVEGMKVLCDTLKFMTLTKSGCRLHELDLWNNNIGDEGMKVLCDALKFMTSRGKCHIKVLHMGCNNIGHEGMKVWIDTLRYMVSQPPFTRALGGCFLISSDIGTNFISSACYYTLIRLRKNASENTFILRSCLFC